MRSGNWALNMVASALYAIAALRITNVNKARKDRPERAGCRIGAGAAEIDPGRVNLGEQGKVPENSHLAAPNMAY